MTDSQGLTASETITIEIRALAAGLDGWYSGYAYGPIKVLYGWQVDPSRSSCHSRRSRGLRGQASRP